MKLHFDVTEDSSYALHFCYNALQIWNGAKMSLIYIYLPNVTPDSLEGRKKILKLNKFNLFRDQGTEDSI